MPDTTAVLIPQCVIVVESLIIIVGNIFTIFVFWKHRNRLKRTSFLLINLAITDLFTGFTQLSVSVGTFVIPQQILASSWTISAFIQPTLTLASLFFLVLISFERAYALIWPLRHRVASTRGYICSVLVVWMAGICVGGLSLLVKYEILNIVHFVATLSSTIVVSLLTICVSYMAIRTRLNCRSPAIESAHNRQNAPEQRAKLARTMFIVIAASLICFLPSTVGKSIHYLCSMCVSSPLVYVFDILYLGNSLVNPIIYSFRMPIFRETLRRMKLCKQSKRYRVKYKP